ncbi:MAG: CCA tRNA nucleotidyltransferase [Nanoarchaeota archaeon]|nr:CCA tRNA nucleotidyltransferase [Nanoarchaeota archaeon]
MDSVLKKVMRRIKPSRSEERKVEKEVRGFVEELEGRIEKSEYEAEVLVGGSYAKGTWLPDPDVDIFVRFEKGNNLSERLREILKGLKYEEVRASRNYYKIGRFEVIPILRISSPEEAKNSMDVSPFHVDFVRKNLKRPDDVRLLKVFCKAIGVYGAESYVSGFSGYVLELLICYYGSFKRLFEEVENWRPKVYLSFSKRREKLSEAKLKSPLILIDPVLPTRNAAASLNYENFSKFVFNARLFLRRPSTKFFEVKPIDEDFLRRRSSERGTKLFLKKVRVKGKRDVFLAKLKRKLDRIKSRVERYGFSVYDYGFQELGDGVLIYFEFETWRCSKRGRHLGPPVWVPKEHFERFLKKWKDVYVHGTRLVADVERVDDARVLLRDLLREYDV